MVILEVNALQKTASWNWMVIFYPKVYLKSSYY